MPDTPHTRDKAKLYTGKSLPSDTRFESRFGWVLSSLRLVFCGLSHSFKTNAGILASKSPRTPPEYLGTPHMVQLR